MQSIDHVKTNIIDTLGFHLVSGKSSLKNEIISKSYYVISRNLFITPSYQVTVNSSQKMNTKRITMNG